MAVSRDLVRSPQTVACNIQTSNTDRKYELREADSTDEYLPMGSTALKSIMTVRTLSQSLGDQVEVQSTTSTPRKKKVLFRFKTGRRMPEKCNEREEKVIDRVLGTTKDTSPSKPKKNLAVNFHHVEIREYEVVPGCNPSITSGSPVELGWKYSEGIVHELDCYENTRCGKRRCQNQLKMSAFDREEVLLIHGSSICNIIRATKKASRTRVQRESTAYLQLLKMKQSEKRKKSSRRVAPKRELGLGGRHRRR